MAGVPSRGVLGVDTDVLVGQVGEENLGLLAISWQHDFVIDLRALQGRPKLGLELVLAEHGRSGRADLDALDRDIQGQVASSEALAAERAAYGLHRTAPVGAAAG